MSFRSVVVGCYASLLACVDPSANARIPAPALASAESNTLATSGTVVPAVSTAAPIEQDAEFWAGELEWARARFPELRDFTPDVDFAPLLEWVPAGEEVTLFVSVDQDPQSVRCAASTAVRKSDEYISMLVPRPAFVEKGEILRRFSNAGAKRSGVDFNYVFGTQRRRKDGTWEEVESWASSGADLGGFIGPVVGDTAHFRYTRMRVDASCGPRVRVLSGDGRIQECNLCQEVILQLSSPRASPRLEPPDFLSCASRPENLELERIKRFAEHFSDGMVLWDGHLSVSLYRTLEACKADPLWKSKAKP